MSTRLNAISLAIVTIMAGVLGAVAAPVLQGHTVRKEHPLGDHPAVLIFKQWTPSSYTSGTAVYLHPATGWWYLQDPNAADQPAPEVPRS
jgi:hypothetical protein